MEIAEANSQAVMHSKSDLNIPTSSGPAIVFGHADADGHLAAEQTRAWLVQLGLDVTTVVSSETRNHRFWGKLARFDLADYAIVVFVDIAFDFKDRAGSLAQLLDVSDRHLQTQFIVLDHHPLAHPQIPRQNVQLVEVADPYDCCLGAPDSELMEVAALCDGAPTAIVPTPSLRKRALGVKRAAADITGVAGDGLLQLIRERRWDFFEALADEDRAMHLSARGMRRSVSEPSPLLEYARRHFPSTRPR